LSDNCSTSSSCSNNSLNLVPSNLIAPPSPVSSDSKRNTIDSGYLDEEEPIEVKVKEEWTEEKVS
jgi:hypothetical protein